MFILIERHKRDLILKEEICIFLCSIESFERFIRRLAKRNKIKITSLNLEYPERLEGIHKRRKEYERERAEARRD